LDLSRWSHFDQPKGEPLTKVVASQPPIYNQHNTDGVKERVNFIKNSTIPLIIEARPIHLMNIEILKIESVRQVEAQALIAISVQHITINKLDQSRRSGLEKNMIIAIDTR
jgi:hypothetical protein